jgi:hypothetical protein
MNGILSSPLRQRKLKEAVVAIVPTLIFVGVCGLCVLLSVAAIAVSLDKSEKLKTAVALAKICDDGKSKFQGPGLLADASPDQAILLKLSNTLSQQHH